MSYSKPKVAFLNVREQAVIASGKKECGDHGCCVKSHQSY